MNDRARSPPRLALPGQATDDRGRPGLSKDQFLGQKGDGLLRHCFVRAKRFPSRRQYARSTRQCRRAIRYVRAPGARRTASAFETLGIEGAERERIVRLRELIGLAAGQAASRSARPVFVQQAVVDEVVGRQPCQAVRMLGQWSPTVSSATPHLRKRWKTRLALRCARMHLRSWLASRILFLAAPRR